MPGRTPERSQEHVPSIVFDRGADAAPPFNFLILLFAPSKLLKSHACGAHLAPASPAGHRRPLSAKFRSVVPGANGRVWREKTKKKKPQLLHPAPRAWKYIAGPCSDPFPGARQHRGRSRKKKKKGLVLAVGPRDRRRDAAQSSPGQITVRRGHVARNRARRSRGRTRPRKDPPGPFRVFGHEPLGRLR